MMKRKTTQQSSESASIIQTLEEPPRGKKAELMSRLARGEKAEVNRKEMLKLTSKNYDNLPEVK